MRHAIFGYLESDPETTFQSSVDDLNTFFLAEADSTQFICVHPEDAEPGAIRDAQTMVTREDMIVVLAVPEDADMPIEKIEEELRRAIEEVTR